MGGGDLVDLMEGVDRINNEISSRDELFEVSPGRYSSDFEPGECLGVGGFGVVLKSKNKLDHVHYAVKRIRLPGEEERRSKVIREVLAMAKLNHKNIVRYFSSWVETPPSGWPEKQDVWYKKASQISQWEANELMLSSSQEDTSSDNSLTSSSNPPATNSLRLESGPLPCLQDKEVQDKEQKSYLYIQMQLCKKDTLKDWLSSPTRTVPRLCKDCARTVLAVFRQIVAGVQYVHAKGLVHRDLKPGNIYFSTDTKSDVKIGDFGLVIERDLEAVAICCGGTCGSQRTQQMGTRTYMSPEQLMGQKDYDHKVDIYSLGLIFLELLVPCRTDQERAKVRPSSSCSSLTSVYPCRC